MRGLTVLDMGRKHAFACNRELGAELRKRRVAAGLTLKDMASHTGWHDTTLSRIETGNAPISMVDLMHYLGACKVYLPQAKELLKLCATAERNLGYWVSSHGEWLEDSLAALVYHESTAEGSTSYEPELIPGLLQTAAYAKARFSRWSQSPDRIQTGVRVRLQRQRILHRPRPARFVFFVHEHALRLRVGSAATMHEQLLHLVLMAALDHVTLRVVPASAGERAAFGGPFRLLEYGNHHPLVYLDNVCTGLFLEELSYVRDYRMLLPELVAVSLDEGQSRQFAADLADEYDRGSRKRDAGIYELEEEQL